MASLVAWALVIYLASVLERAMEVCFLELQLTAAPTNINMLPNVDLQLLISVA
jgi:hypothetical protein